MNRLSEYADSWLREINYRFRDKCRLVGNLVIINLTQEFTITLQRDQEEFKIAVHKNGKVIDKCFTTSEHAEEIWDHVQPTPAERKAALDALDKFLEENAY